MSAKKKPPRTPRSAPRTPAEVDRFARVANALAVLPEEDRAWAIERLAPAWWLRQRAAAPVDGFLLVALGFLEGAPFTRATLLATKLARRAKARARLPGRPGTLVWLLDKILAAGRPPGAWTIHNLEKANDIRAIALEKKPRPFPTDICEGAGHDEHQ